MTTRTTGLSLKDAAAELGLTRPALIKRLREQGIFHASSATPHERYIKAGYFCVAIKEHHATGFRRQYAVTKVTGHGLCWLRDLFANQSTAA